MDERQAGSAGAAAAFIALITLLTVAALLAPRFSAPIVEPQAAPVAEPAVPSVEMWLSTADRRLRLEPQPDIVMDVGDASPADIVIDIKKTYQTMDGFGAAMTDSSAWLLQHKLNALQRSALLQELYGPPPNLDFNMMRLTIGASDFSLKPYTLDDVPSGQTDETLEHFNVTSNLQDVIPVVREVLTIDPGMLIMATPWSAPAWMKTSQNLIGGELLPQYEDNYADYLVKYLDAMRGNGIPIFALTLQNEPGFVPITYPGMQMPSDTRARVIGQFLGPRLAARQPATRILEWDHNWSQPEQPMSVLADPVATRYISGVAWHCYEGNPFNQGRVHHAFPQKDVYLTECSGGDWASAAKGELIWFARDLLVTGIRQWARGVIYWNLELDENHGPHFGGCELCKGVVTIDSKTGAISRNDYYYALGHFSRFVLPGAMRVGSTATGKGIDNVAFQNRSNGSIVLVVVNSDTVARDISVAEGDNRFSYQMPPRSVATFEWNLNPADALLRRIREWLLRGRS